MNNGKPKHVGREEVLEEQLIRIYASDIPGSSSVYAGLTRIKGISWAISNAICYTLKLDKNKKVYELTEKEIEAVNNFLKNPKLPQWLLNRKRDRETGEDKHLVTNDLDFAKEWDIRRLKRVKSYKGWRHALGQPVRGQRTKGHFREKGKAVGVSKKGKK